MALSSPWMNCHGHVNYVSLTKAFSQAMGEGYINLWSAHFGIRRLMIWMKVIIILVLIEVITIVFIVVGHPYSSVLLRQCSQLFVSS